MVANKMQWTENALTVRLHLVCDVEEGVIWKYNHNLFLINATILNTWPVLTN